jgi:hypothetical protein
MSMIATQRLEEMQCHIDEGGQLKCDQELVQEVCCLKEENGRLREKLKEITRAYKQKAKHVDNLLKLKRTKGSGNE